MSNDVIIAPRVEVIVLCCLRHRVVVPIPDLGLAGFFFYVWWRNEYDLARVSAWRLLGTILPQLRIRGAL